MPDTNETILMLATFVYPEYVWREVNYYIYGIYDDTGFHAEKILLHSSLQSDSVMSDMLDDLLKRRTDLSFSLGKDWYQTEWEVTFEINRSDVDRSQNITKGWGKTRAEAICSAILALREKESLEHEQEIMDELAPLRKRATTQGLGEE